MTRHLLLIDESKNVIFANNSSHRWDISTVVGAILPANKRKKWLEKYTNTKKGSEFSPDDEKEICAILDYMYTCRIKAVLVIADRGFVSTKEADRFRDNWISSAKEGVSLEPIFLRDKLYHHLDNLAGKGENRFSLQDFFKTLLILEVIFNLLNLLIGSLNQKPPSYLKKLSILIDDQCKASLPTLKEFSYYFLNHRSRKNPFKCPPGAIHLLKDYLKKGGDRTFLDLTKLIDEIQVEEKASMDDKYQELKIADLLANFSRRILLGEFSPEIVIKLKKILKIRESISFHPDYDVIANLPPYAEDAINLLLQN